MAHGIFLLRRGLFVAALGLLCSCGVWALWFAACRLSNWGARAQLPCGMWDLSFPPRDWTHVPCIGRQILYHWTTREVPLVLTFKLLLVSTYSGFPWLYPFSFKGVSVLRIWYLFKRHVEWKKQVRSIRIHREGWGMYIKMLIFVGWRSRCGKLQLSRFDVWAKRVFFGFSRVVKTKQNMKEYATETIYVPLPRLKYLVSGPSQKTLANPWSRSDWGYG